jgi:nucleoside-diphosphate-sugar epimerase
MKLLVTGASGYLGKLAVSALSGEHSVVATSRTPLPALPCEHVPCDLGSTPSESLWDRQFDVIFHCAALIPKGVGDPAEPDFLGANVSMASNVAKIAKLVGASRIVNLSSCAVYQPASETIDEDSPKASADRYALGKLSAEKTLEEISGPSGIQSAHLRISAPYGPSSPHQTVMAAFAGKIKSGEHLELWGEGTRGQHFVYEADVIQAVELALSSKHCGPFNIAGPKPCTMVELALIFLEAAGVGRERLRFAGTDNEEGVSKTYSIDRARRLLGYNPRWELKEGVRSLLDSQS